jgi:site-specific DNA-methyltransferase (adenine-specific)
MDTLHLLPEYSITPNTIHHMDIFELCNAMPNESVDMILCDLPYGMTNCRWDTIIPLSDMWNQFNRIAKPNAPIVLTATQPFTSVLVSSNYEMYRHNWIWDKNRAPNFLNANREPLRQHEDVLVFSIEPPNYYPQMVASDGHTRGSNSKNNGEVYGKRRQVRKSTAKTRYPKTILNYPTEDNAQKVHPTQKPVSLFRYLIETYTQEDDLVFDPCIGSGTTFIAARKSNRNCIGGDSSAEYVEVARNRTGLELTFSHDDLGELQQLNMFA